MNEVHAERFSGSASTATPKPMKDSEAIIGRLAELAALASEAAGLARKIRSLPMELDKSEANKRTDDLTGNINDKIDDIGSYLLSALKSLRAFI